ncbi:hypothetical protein CLV98_10916 [Dyadobacter jejuensis]|uniref:Uncharacterized protein n=1 Tax=Dyadobacter jejuensis TaxID=1082580 RepID=A0A316B2Y1_9BACT|nr:hypothetical protein CLV98_10916 [Dyadobacter jejuensis]
MLDEGNIIQSFLLTIRRKIDELSNTSYNKSIAFLMDRRGIFLFNTYEYLIVGYKKINTSVRISVISNSRFLLVILE